MKNTARTREELEKKKKELIAEAGQSTKLQELQEEAEDIKDNKAGKAEAVAGFWRPGGVVRRRKEATPHLTEDQKLSNDVVFLMKKLWGAFFKESNLDIHMHKAKGRAKKAKDSSKGTGTDIIKQQRKNLKVRSIAGLVHMAELVARAYGRRKDSDESGSGSVSDEEKDARKKKAQARKQKGRGKAVQEGKFGPFVPNGVLKRDANSAKAWDLLGKRMAHHRQADSLFQLLGWGEDLSDPDGITGELINRLLQRALHVAELREHQV
ncbi:hypothetical protein HaLaN_20679 [Haematococcus lacustris]|uniref:Uncharacterized protein n=1 Tax=Haematococcus lacustris TaxID=44745 RepID=A0A699ZK16_HAELA|nr:hypothetical protein HaLaN_20679 [Haematococcus lacustris]